jgi:tetratricopeptide (TPR) repeat protein
MSGDAFDDDVDQHVARLMEANEEAIERCQFATALRINQELGQLAKRSQRLIPYLHSRFTIANNARSMLDPERGREAAIELIALLESEERARQFQPDFPEDEYAHTVGWMSSCAYDNLAENTALILGYNSDGMQACINEGIQVCRRTGKLRCIACFHEYATDVYSSADDLDMALHSARMVSGLSPDAPGAERRWVGLYQEARLQLMRGDIEAAEAVLVRAFEIAPTYHSPDHAEIQTRVRMRTVRLLAGKPDEPEPEDAEASAEAPTAEEYLRFTKDAALGDALAASCAQDWKRAEEILLQWDRKLTEARCVDDWFDVRLRLIAHYRLTDNTSKVQALAKHLEAKASEARDFLTLRRLQRLMDPAIPASPLALLGSLSVGPFASVAATQATADAVADASSQEEQAEDVPMTPLHERLIAFLMQLQSSADDPEALAGLLKEIMAIPLADVTHPLDAARILHVMPALLGEAEPTEEMWQWAQQLAERFPHDAAVKSLLAHLGAGLRQLPEWEERISAERIEAMFREALDLAPDGPGGYARAAQFFMSIGNVDECERCLARSFRLDRTNGVVALQLAQIYQSNGRPADALAVLDLSLREGCEDPDVAWRAAALALDEQAYTALLTYLDQFEEWRPGEPWVNYYRTLALLETSRPAEARTAIDEEERRNEEKPVLYDVLRASAAAGLGEIETCRAHIEGVLETGLRSVDYLTPSGLGALCERLWNAARTVNDPKLQNQLDELLLISGFIPDAYFVEQPPEGEVQSDVGFYRVMVMQPLDERWQESPGCLSGREEWQSYLAFWGVLAADEADAAEIALRWQNRCSPLPGEVQGIEFQSGGYQDAPRVIWQGARIEPVDEDEEEEV